MGSSPLNYTKQREQRIYHSLFPLLVRMTGLEPARQRQRNLNPPSLPIPPHPHLLSYSIIVLLRCPVCALLSAQLRCTPTAATRSGRCICHRQRSLRSPRSCHTDGTLVFYHGSIGLSTKIPRQVSQNFSTIASMPFFSISSVTPA